jgi:hypothetical protein
MGHDDVTLREAIERHLAENGFPPDGGRSQRWVAHRIGRIPLCIPNISANRRAIPIHDMNHVVSGYGHDALGEGEVGAWELGSGYRDYTAAWVLGSAAMGRGFVHSPTRVFAAFVRGRQTENLFGADIETAMNTPVSMLRTSLRLDGHYSPNTGDALLFVAALAWASAAGLSTALVSLATSPVWLARGAHRQRRIANI